MKVEDIKLVYEYNYWANKRILTACGNVDQEQYVAANHVSNFGSLRATLVHTLDSEFGWFLVFDKYFVPASVVKSGSLPAAQAWDIAELTEADLPTFAALKARWQAQEGTMRAYLDRLRDENMNGLIRYRVDENVRERVLWHCLVHVVNHGTQHRSEAAAMLTQYGQSPGEQDFTVYLNDHWQLPTENQ